MEHSAKQQNRSTAIYRLSQHCIRHQRSLNR
jgi:hypothetical protein